MRISDWSSDVCSSDLVRFRIKSLIDTETAVSVLSDDRIVEILKADGVDIARRTVAKYREAMRIPSSVQRRRDKGISQIGRESCRERVCQYVSISVVAVSLKKKRIKNKRPTKDK